MNSGYGRRSGHSREDKLRHCEFIRVTAEPQKQLVDLVGFDDASEGYFSGQIKCSLYVLNKLLVGNEHQTDKNDHTTIHPLTIMGGVHISPYTLKGCISSFIAQLMGIPISRLNWITYNKPGLTRIKLNREQQLLGQKGYAPFLKGELADPVNPRLTLLKSMFGYSLSKEDKQYLKLTGNPEKNWESLSAKAGKVNFNYASYVENTGCFMENCTIPLAGTPAATIDYFSSLDRNSISLKGRKVYKRFHTHPKTTHDKTISLVKVAAYDQTKNSYPCFRFTCHVENLLPLELDLLLFALHLGQEKFDTSVPRNKLKGVRSHQIGFGKNFGMGAVKITVDRIDPMPRALKPDQCEKLLASNETLLNNLIYNPQQPEFDPCRR